MRMEHKLRTPLMAAAATGDLGLFKTVLGAVNRAIERPVSEGGRGGAVAHLLGDPTNNAAKARLW